MNPIEACTNFVTKCFDFSSRASRTEYWWAIIMPVIAWVFIIYAVDALEANDITPIGLWLPFLVIFMIIANISLQVRRLHDVGRSGWWLLLNFTGIGLIPLLFWFLSRGVEGRNRFGDDPQMR